MKYKASNEDKQRWIQKRNAENAERAERRAQLDFNIAKGLQKLVNDNDAFVSSVAESLAFGYHPSIDVCELVDIKKQIDFLKDKFLDDPCPDHWFEDEEDE